MARDRITKRLVDGLKTTGAEYFAWDAELKGFGVRVQASGAKSYVFKYSHGAGRGAPTRRMTLARVGKVTPEEARGLAKRRAGEVAHGADPAMERRKAAASAEGTLRCVVENYLAREGYKLRTVDLRRTAFKRVLSALGARQIGDIKRSDINSILDTIEDESGANTATLTLAYLRRVMNWHATRADDFRSPIVRGMARAVAVKRDRVLTEDELRAFWRASEQWDHPFSRMLRFVMLTATRRDEAADMRWAEVNGDTWTIPAARYKTNIDFELPLSGTVRKLLAPIARIGDAGFVFTMSGKHGMQGFSKFKAEFDGRMLAEARRMAAERGDDPEKVTLERWTIHDLRRTARSLMTQAGIAPDHAERALGHVILGVRGVYDRHSYHTEKQNAFEALAAQVARILDPAPNVVQLRPGKAG
jgi:integrase